MGAYAGNRETTINLRATQLQKDLIDRAAELTGQSRSGFMLDASVERAQSLLAERNRFVLSVEQMSAFHAALDAPLEQPEALRRLLERKAQWST